MRLFVVCAAVVLVASGCSSADAPVEEPTPSEVEVQSLVELEPSLVPVDPMSAQIICQDLRLWDAYRQADLPQEAEVMAEVGEDIATRALEQDAEPGLREIALEHEGDAPAMVEALIPWCQEHTEVSNPTSPW
ncbi:hypothetical protein Q8791_29330 [Nocardiopsis sp. CT-R113]|uniref:DUF732 domain-containing protein n=1 Tax=Nocardiopsis codii TaxID=3065942 RepID=A0ABU7KGH6_9ACTN|nr:hypothetical protein [Nocardiopsis sp. CT-R113]MEE2041334.1 hypothetical protein [Nocardiopsis sp. CT-R113]